MSDQPTTAVQPQMIALARINVAEGHNPRSAFEDAQLAELAASIAEHGVLSPILVSPDEQAEGEFRRQGAITKTGSILARRLLVSWTGRCAR